MSRNAILLCLALLCGVNGVNLAFAESPGYDVPAADTRPRQPDTPRTQRLRGSANGDNASTIAAVAAGAVETNPFGLAVIPMKYAILEEVSKDPNIATRVHTETAVASLWGGAAVNNWCVLASILTGGAFGLACPALGIVYGVADYQQSQADRTASRACQAKRTLLDDPNYDCTGLFAWTEPMTLDDFNRGEACWIRRQETGNPRLPCEQAGAAGTSP